MKTIITRTALLLTMVFTLGYTNAAEPATPLPSVAPAMMERELDHQINKYVTYPLLSHNNMDGEVVVSFVINTEGKIEVINAHSANTDLCEYVLRKLSKVDIGSNPGGLWKTTHMRFVFHPEA